MSRGKAITLGLFTAWPILYMLLFFCAVFGMMMLAVSGSKLASKQQTIIIIIFLLHFLTMLEMMVLLAIYIYHVFKTDRVPQDQKALWAVVLFLGNCIAMPIYWYLYIWREQKPLVPDDAFGEMG
jgi:hypothetical protein